MKNLISVLIGNAIEYYCLTLYGFLAVLLAPVYFPNESTQTSLLMSFGLFSLGFIMRPVGAVFFGHLGDKWGRKPSLILSILLITAPTILIGFTPAYDKIGVIAPILVTIFRLMQGFCSGGESTISAIFLNEHSHENNEGFLGSVLCASSLIGALLGTAACALFTSTFMPSWGWRLPFILAGFLAILGLILRKELQETPSFLKLQHLNKIKKIPFTEVIKHNWDILLAGIGISSTSLIPFYISSVYLNKFILQILNLNHSQAHIFNTYFMLLWVVLLPIAGKFSDKISKIDMMIFGSILIIITSLPILYCLSEATLMSLTFAQILLILSSTIFVAPINAMMPKLFPETNRCSGFSISFALGASLFGGSAPLIISFLSQYTDYATSLYLAFSGVIGFVSLFYIKYKKKILHVESYEK